MAAPPVRDQGAREVHPDRENVGGKRGDRAAEDPHGKGRRQAAVLHSDLDRDGSGLRLAEMCKAPGQSRDPVPAQVTDDVMGDSSGDEQRAGRGQNTAARGRDGDDRKADPGHGQNGERTVANVLVPGELLTEKIVDDRTGGDGDHDHFQDLDHHFQDVDLDEAPREDFHGHRRDERREQGGAARHGDRKRYVGFGEKRDDVRGRASCDRPDEYAPGGQLGREAADLRQRQPNQRHDEELKPDADPRANL